MCSQRRRLPHKPAHQALAAMLAALGIVPAAPAQSQQSVTPAQSQQNVMPSNQAQAPATKHPVTTPNTTAQKPGTPALQKPGAPTLQKPGTPTLQKPGTPTLQNLATTTLQKPGTTTQQSPGTTIVQKLRTATLQSPGTKTTQSPGTATPPKPSLWQRILGGNQNAQPNNNSKPDNSSKQQPSFWNKIPFVGGHSGSSSEQSRTATSIPGQSRAPSKPQPGLARTGAPESASRPKDNRPGAQNPQRLATISPSSSPRSPASFAPAPQPRPFPVRPGSPATSEVRMPNGNLARTAADGSVTDVHISQHNMSVHYGLNGSRQIRVDQPDGSRIVLASRGVPYVQKPWNFGARAFDHRTFLNNGQLTHQFYRPYTYGDTTLDVYAPQRFYSQEFYQWAAKPQSWTPPSWTYVTRQEPWYTHYQTYFTAQPSYSSPTLWLTDFVLAMSLFEAYNAHQLPARSPPAAPTVPSAPTPQAITQASTAPAPIVQPPIAQPPPPAAAAKRAATDQAPIVAPPATAAATTQAPIVTPPATAQASIVTPPATPAPNVQAPMVVPAAIPVARTSVPASPTGAGDGSTSLTLWQRFSNFIRSLFGEQTPVQNARVEIAPAATPASVEPVVADSAAPITADVKSLVADEIGRQIEQESREARENAQNQEPKPGAGGIVEELRRPTQHVFVVASDLDLVDDNGRRCMISEGDVIQIISAVNAKTGTAQGVVLSSKGGVECAHSATLDIAVTDLQEMQNHMRATIDQGLANMPRGATEPTVTPAFAAAAPPPDAEAKSAIEQQKAIAAAADRG